MESLLWFVLEGVAALVAAILIVWWTWPKGGTEDARDKPPDRK